MPEREDRQPEHQPADRAGHDRPARGTSGLQPPGGDVMQGPGQSTGPGEPLPDRQGSPAGAPNADATIAQGGSEDDVREQGAAAAAASRGRTPTQGPSADTGRPSAPDRS